MESGADGSRSCLRRARQIPVAPTLLGLGGFPASHPLTLGMMGMHGESWVNHAIQDADLLLAFGMRFDDRVTGNLATYAPNAKKIHIEIDPSEINKNVKVDVALIGDLREVLEDPAAVVHAQASRDGSAWLKTDRTRMKGDAAVRDIINLPDNGHLYAAHVIHDIWRELSRRPRERPSSSPTWASTRCGRRSTSSHETPRSLVTSGGLGTMGFALPAAIGAKIACPEKDVWVIAGDGGFQMTAAELSTIVQEKITINIAVINNGYLGMVRQWQEAFYDKNYAASPILSPDFVTLAAAHGIARRHVNKRTDVIPTVTRARPAANPSSYNFQVEAMALLLSLLTTLSGRGRGGAGVSRGRAAALAGRGRDGHRDRLSLALHLSVAPRGIRAYFQGDRTAPRREKDHVRPCLACRHRRRLRADRRERRTADAAAEARSPGPSAPARCDPRSAAGSTRFAPAAALPNARRRGRSSVR